MSIFPVSAELAPPTVPPMPYPIRQNVEDFSFFFLDQNTSVQMLKEVLFNGMAEINSAVLFIAFVTIVLLSALTSFIVSVISPRHLGRPQPLPRWAIIATILIAALAVAGGNVTVAAALLPFTVSLAVWIGSMAGRFTLYVNEGWRGENSLASRAMDIVDASIEDDKEKAIEDFVAAASSEDRRRMSHRLKRIFSWGRAELNQARDGDEVAKTVESLLAAKPVTPTEKLVAEAVRHRVASMIVAASAMVILFFLHFTVALTALVIVVVILDLVSRVIPDILVKPEKASTQETPDNNAEDVPVDVGVARMPMPPIAEEGRANSA